MQILKYPHKKQWDRITNRPTTDNTQLFKIAQNILDDIKRRGDTAIKEYELKFDNVQLDNLEVSIEEKNTAIQSIPNQLKQAILISKKNIEKFHTAQKNFFPKIKTSTGVVCWQKALPIEKIGLYIPGGMAPLFSSVLMLATPAKIVGCKEIILCTPPNSNNDNTNIHPAILFAAKESGVNRIFKIGGIQAIGAMAYGTQSVPSVYKIFGPGNQYVTAAKQLVSLSGISIDMPAGPSEVVIIADETANPIFIAADLLSQAEHGVDSQAILLTLSEKLVKLVVAELTEQLKTLPRKMIAKKALSNSKIIILKNQQEIIDLTNLYAPEHLIIETNNYNYIANKIINAGSVFLGHYTPESAGDYASGTNHTLPTNGYAKSYSGVNLDSFIKKITFQKITKEGIKQFASTIEIMAENEQLQAHKNAVTFRKVNH